MRIDVSETLLPVPTDNFRRNRRAAFDNSAGILSNGLMAAMRLESVIDANGCYRAGISQNCKTGIAAYPTYNGTTWTAAIVCN